MAAAQPLEIEIPMMRYDIMQPLLEGRVPIDGVTLKPIRGVSSMVTSRNTPLADGSFGLADLNLGYFLPAIEEGWELVGLPVFSKRKPVFTYIFCRPEIAAPRDLEGKRIGAARYRSAITIWLRGLLRHRYGVDISTMRWVVWGGEVFPVHDEQARIEAPPDPSKSLVDSLLDGEIDAMMTDISDRKTFEVLESDPRVHRLFPDYIAEDRRLYQETGIYTPVHLIVMSKKLDRQYPELAGKLYAAFERSKQLAYDDILSDMRGFSVVYLRERMKEQMAEWGDPFGYGIAANARTIDTFVQYNVEQGMVRSSYTHAQMFAESTLET